MRSRSYWDTACVVCVLGEVVESMCMLHVWGKGHGLPTRMHGLASTANPFMLEIPAARPNTKNALQFRSLLTDVRLPVPISSHGHNVWGKLKRIIE